MGHEAGQPGVGEDAAELRERVARLETQVAELQQELRGVRDAAPSRPQRSVFALPRAKPLPVGPGFAAKESPGAKVKDLESELGSKVISKIAVLLLLVGAAWFLKWAVDNRWIGPVGRVIAGLVAGAGLIVWSDRFRKNGTPGFSYALKAVGSGVLYLSLWASFQLYHLVPAPVAFAAMLAVTAWNATLALTQDSRLLAGYALLGAYLTPALLSTGGDHEVFLCSYLATIAAAVALLLRKRPWNVLLAGPLPATTAYFIVWYIGYYEPEKCALTLGLAALLWAVLAAIPLVAEQVDDAIAGVLQPIGAAIFGALTVYSVLVDGPVGARAWEPWAAIAFAAAYLGLSRLRRGTVVAAIHLSLALSFLTVAIPLKATGHGITLGWLAEALALLWLAHVESLEARSRAALQWLALAAMLLGTGGALLGPWFFPAGKPAFLNREFATSLGAVVVLAAAMWLWKRVAPLAFVLLNLVLVVAMRREITLALSGDGIVDFAFSGWLAVQGAAMLAAGFWKRAPLARWMGLLLLAVTLAKTVLYDMRHLGSGYRVVSYLALGVLLLAVSYAYQKDWLGLHVALGEDEQETDA